MKLSVQVIVHPDNDPEGPAVVREVFALDRDALAPTPWGWGWVKRRTCWPRCMTRSSPTRCRARSQP